DSVRGPAAVEAVNQQPGEHLAFRAMRQRKQDSGDSVHEGRLIRDLHRRDEGRRPAIPPGAIRIASGGEEHRIRISRWLEGAERVIGLPSYPRHLESRLVPSSDCEVRISPDSA